MGMRGKKEANLFWDGALKRGGLQTGYIAAVFMLNFAVIQSSQYIARAVDCLLYGQWEEVYSLTPSLAMIIISGVLAVCGKRICGNNFSEEISREVRDLLGGHFRKLPYGYCDKRYGGLEETGFMEKIDSDLKEAEHFLAEFLPEFLVNVITVFMMTVYLGHRNAMLLILLYAGYLLILPGTGRARRQREDNSKDQVIKIVITVIPAAGCYFFALYEMLTGKITVGEMLSYIVLAGCMIRGIGTVILGLRDFRSAGVSLKRLQEIYDIKVEKNFYDRGIPGARPENWER